MVGGLEPWNFMTFHILGEFHHPNWPTHIFQRGGSTINQIVMLWHFWHTKLCYYCYGTWLLWHSRKVLLPMCHFSLVNSFKIYQYPWINQSSWPCRAAHRLGHASCESSSNFHRKKSRRGTACHRGFRLFAGETSCWRAMKNAVAPRFWNTSGYRMRGYTDWILAKKTQMWGKTW